MAVNVNGAAATIGDRSLCATSTGRLWQALLNTTTIQMWYSDDSGATWTQNTSAQITGVTANTVCALFIDADDHAHIIYATGTNSINTVYQRMVSISATSSWASGRTIASTGDNSYTPKGIVAHREGTGWVAHALLHDYHMGTSATQALYKKIPIPANGDYSATTVDYAVPDGAASGTAFTTVGIDFHHTAASVTAIQGSTPHLYVAWLKGADIKMAKVTYASGVWTWGTNRTLGSDAYTTGQSAAMIFDGDRTLVPAKIALTTPTVKLYERDAADTTTTGRTLTSVTMLTVNVTYDGNGDVWLFGDTDLSIGAGETRYKVYDRSADTWGTETTVEAEVNTGNMVGVRRGGGYDMDAVWGITGSVRFERTGAPHPPTAPTWVSPVDFAGADVGASLVLDWAFNDPHPSDTQGKYAVRRQIGAGTLYYWRASDSSWQTSETANVSATTSLTLASSWGADGDASHTYAVKTWDAGLTEGVYGANLTVVPSTPDLPTITTPADASTHVTSTLTAVWTVATQTTYLVELLNSAGTTTLWSSGTQTSTGTRSHAIAYTLLNGVSYKVRVTTANDEGLVGTADTNSFSVAYSAPAVPIVTVTSDTPTGAITVAHANLNPVGTQPTVTSADIYVRCTTGNYADGERPVAGNGIRVKTGLAPEANWIDYAPASGRAYEYMVRVHGDNGTTTDSAWMSAAPDPALPLLLEATLWLDSAYSVAGEQSVVNQGTGGAALNARYGSTTGADTNDPLLSTHEAGGNYAYLPGVAGNHLSVALTEVGSLASLEFAVKVTPTAVGVTSYLAGWDGTWASFLLDTPNTLYVYIYNTTGGQIGNAQSSVAVPGITAGVPIWLKGKVTAADAVCEYWYSNDTTEDAAAVSWTSVGTPQTGTYAGTTPAVALSDNLVYGSISYTGAGMVGRIHAGQETVDGTVRSQWTAAAITDSDATTFTAAVGPDITVNRSTSGRKTVLVTRPVWLLGTDDYFEIADNALLDFGATDSFTVLAAGRTWATFATNDALVAKKADNTDTTQGWALTAGTTAAQVAFDVGDGTAGAGAVTASRTTGVSYVTAGVRNTATDTLTTYLNGTAGTPVTDTTTGTSANAEVMRVGRLSGAGTEYADTELLAVAVFRRALTTTEIANLVAYYEAG